MFRETVITRLHDALKDKLHLTTVEVADLMGVPRDTHTTGRVRDLNEIHDLGLVKLGHNRWTMLNDTSKNETR